MITRDHIQELARSWLDTPFRHQGRTKGVKCDCVGLIVGVGHELGMPTLHAPTDYAMAPASNLVLTYARKQLVEMPDKTLAPGRIVICWGFDRFEAQHLGIIGDHAGRHTLIHAFSKRGKVIEASWDMFWQKRLVAVFEYPDTEPMGA